MDPKKKAKRVGIAFIALFIIAGLVLMYTGNDAVVLAVRQKEGILTAEQVKMSFDSVSGRFVREAVQEGDEVRAGDIIMELDATDNKIAMARVNAQIAQIEAQRDALLVQKRELAMRIDASEYMKVTAIVNTLADPETFLY